MRWLTLLVLVSTLRTGHADTGTWHTGAAGKRRLTHLALSGAGILIYAASETVLKPTLAPSECRWCTPTSVDVAVRDALRWDSPARAKQISDGTAFLVAPVTGLGLLVVAQRGLTDAGFARWLDDAIPVVESALIASLLNQAVKFTVGEQRPFVHFGDPARPAEVDDNVSFYSGHTTFAFSIAASASLVAHRRGYKLAPLLWASSFTFAVGTGYLRIAADKHYFTDVAVGAVTGTAIGLAVPLLLHDHVTASVVPTRDGLALVGTF